MSKYTLLILLNLPFVIFGVAKAISAYKKGTVGPMDLAIRLGFWLLVLIGLIFAEEIYDYLVVKGLTDSTPLSIADVVLVTGLSFCLFLILRLYGKLEAQERRFANLHERLSIVLSEKAKSHARKK